MQGVCQLFYGEFETDRQGGFVDQLGPAVAGEVNATVAIIMPPITSPAARIPGGTGRHESVSCSECIPS